MSRNLPVVVASLAFVAGALALAQSAAQPLDDSQPVELSSDHFRPALRRRMTRHARMLDELERAVLAGEDARVAELAEALERDTGLGAWRGADAGPSARKNLERLENELRQRSRSLADVARRGADAEMPAAYGQLMETCVRCHQETFPPTGRRGSDPR